MVAKSSSTILEQFHKKVQKLERMRKKQENLFSKGLILRRDIEEIYGAIFLNTMATFESLIEDLFVGLLTGQIKPKRSNIKPRIQIKSPLIARDVILQDRPFLKWLPYENTKKIARTFFTDGRPFTLLAKSEENHIDKCLTIRNVIAHHSRHAVGKFQREVLGDLSLTPREKSPKGFLRAELSASPPATYYQQLVSELLKIESELC